MRVILASASPIRRALLDRAGVKCDAMPARIDEEAMRLAMAAEGARPRDVADTLAEAKARKLSLKHPAAMVIGCDQVLDHGGKILSKPQTVEEARDQLRLLRGTRHALLSAAVIYADGEPVWRHVGEVRLTMRPFSDTYLESYLSRNWPEISDSVGGYKLEEEGVRLFERIDGDYFNVLGLPLLPLLSYLTLRGVIDG